MEERNIKIQIPEEANELIHALQKNGYEAYVFFVIQMKEVQYLVPNDKTQPM